MSEMFKKLSVEQAERTELVPALYATEAELVKQELEPKCEYCEGTGIYHRQDGQDDFVDVECVCQLDKDESDLLDLEK